MIFKGIYLFAVIIPPITAARASFESVRVERTYTQTLSAAPDVVMPLLTPTGERLWTQGEWKPRFFFRPPGASEEGSIFRTTHGNPGETWIMTKYDLANSRVEYLRFAPSHIGEIKIQLESLANTTRARLLYRYTGLTNEGTKWIRKTFTEEGFRAMAKEWEDALNAYLHPNR